MSADPDINVEQWEQRVRETAGALDYPATPDLAARLRIEAMPSLQQQRSRTVAIRRMAFAAMALVLLGVLVMAVPTARATVLEWLRIGAVQITLQEPTPAPTQTPLPTTAPPTATPQPLSTVLDLGGETTLDVVRRDVRFPIKMPAYPSSLGQPSAVFAQELGDQTVMLVWVDPAQPRKVTLALHILGPNAFVEKVEPRKLQDTRVNGQPALWANGEYLLRTHSGDMDIRRLITGNVLIWREGDITYRLETDLPVEEAVKIAASLR
jgi:hypothetical protein